MSMMRKNIFIDKFLFDWESFVASGKKLFSVFISLSIYFFLFRIILFFSSFILPFTSKSIIIIENWSQYHGNVLCLCVSIINISNIYRRYIFVTSIFRNVGTIVQYLENAWFLSTRISFSVRLNDVYLLAKKKWLHSTRSKVKYRSAVLCMWKCDHFCFLSTITTL